MASRSFAFPHPDARHWKLVAVAVACVALLATALPFTPIDASTRSGTLVGFGVNEDGQLGRNSGSNTLHPSLRSVRFAVLDGGESHSVGLTEAGDVWTWGANDQGQLGRPLSLSLQSGQANPGIVSLTLAPGEVVVDVAAGANHSLALTSQGRLFGWGDNSLAQLGVNPNALLLAPTPVEITIRNADGLPLLGETLPSQLFAVDAGDNHSVALRAVEAGQGFGELYTWGANERGQAQPLGDLASTDDLDAGALSPVILEPTKVDAFGGDGVGGNFTAVAAGPAHTVVVHAADQAYGFGDNANGQVQPGGDDPIRIPTTLGGQGTVAASASATDTLLLKDDASVKHLGNATPHGVTNDGGTILTDVVALASGNDHHLAIVDESTDTEKAWALVAFGHTGGAPEISIPSGTDPTIVAIGAGGEHSLAALAPDLSIAPDAITFPLTEAGTSSAPLTATVTNDGPGSATLGAPAISGNFALDPDTTTCTSSLDPDTSCDIGIAFEPPAGTLGTQTGTLTLSHDGFAEDFEVDLSGEATQLEGSIVIEADGAPDGDALTVTASPPQMPLNDIPLQPSSPAAQDEERAGLPILRIGGMLPILRIGGLPILRIGDAMAVSDLQRIGGLPILRIGGLPILRIGGLPILRIGEEPIRTGLPILRISPKTLEALNEVALADILLQPPFAWNGPDAIDVADPTTGGAVLTGTDLADEPLHEVPLSAVLEDPSSAVAQRFAAIPADHVLFADHVLGRVGVNAYLLGGLPLQVIDPARDWCAEITPHIPDCASGYGRAGSESNALSASAFELQASGLPLLALELGQIEVQTVVEAAAANEDGAPVTSFLLDRLPLFYSDLGSIELDDIPSSTYGEVIDDSELIGHETNLWEASESGALRETATIAHLGAALGDMTLSELLYGLLPLDERPYGAATLDSMLVQYYGGEGTSKVPYVVTYANDANALPHGRTLTVDLPTSFRMIPDAAVVTVEDQDGNVVGGPADSEPPVFNDETDTFEFRLPDISVGPDQDLKVRFNARPGIQLGTFVVPKVTLATDGGGLEESESPGAAVRVVDPELAHGQSADGALDGGDDDAAAAQTLVPSDLANEQVGQLRLGWINHDRDLDVYRLDSSQLPAGGELQVFVEHQTPSDDPELPTDADVFLFGADGLSGEQPLRTPSKEEPLTLSPDKNLGNDADTHQVPSDVNLAERAGLPRMTLLAVSQHRDAYEERIVFRIPENIANESNAGKDLFLVVRGYDGAYSDLPYSLRARVIPGLGTVELDPRPAQASPIGLPADAPEGTVVLHGDPTAADTIFLTAPTRMEDDPNVDLIAALRNPALHDLIGSTAVLAVDQDDTVAAALAAMDADPGDLTLENDVVRGINQLVDDLRGTNVPDYLVLVGGTHVLPMANLPDLSSSVDQRPFVFEMVRYTDPEASGNSSFLPSLDNRIQSDDPYFDLAPRAVAGLTHFYLPDMTGSRMVENEAEIVGLIDQFIQFGGIADLSTAVTTSSATFLDDLAESVDGELTADGADTDPIITDEQWGENPRQTLEAAIQQNQVLALQGHSSPVATEIGGANLDVVGPDILGLAQANSVLLSVGCNLLLPLPDSVVRSTIPTEFSQTAAAEGVSSATGKVAYGAGVNGAVAYDEELLVRYADHMADAPLGSALRLAKAEFAAEAGHIDEVDLKVLQTMQHFGLPHLASSTAAGSTAVAGSATVSGSGGEGSTPVGISAEVGTDLQRHDVTMEGEIYSYYDHLGETTEAANQPILPLHTSQVAPAGTEVTGVRLESASSFEAPVPAPNDPFLPLVADPSRTGGLETGAPTIADDLAFPGNQVSFDGRDLQVTLGSHVGKGGQHSQTIFTQVGGQARWSSDPDTGLAIESFDIFVDDTTATFVVEVQDHQDDDGLGVDDVTALYELIDTGGDGDLVPRGTWQLLQLHRLGEAGGLETWVGFLDLDGATAARSLAQAEAGNQVVHFKNKARFTKSVRLPSGPFVGFTSLEVDGTPAPSNDQDDPDPTGWFHDATITATAPSPITVHVDGEEEQDASGATPNADNLYEASISLSDDGLHFLTLETDGHSVLVLVKIDATPPTITSDLQDSYGPDETPTADFSCDDEVSGVTRCEGHVISDGQVIATGVQPGDPLPSGQAGTYTLVVEAADLAGNENVESFSYSSLYEFVGFNPPVKNRPATNTKWSAGQTVPLKFHLFHPDGTPVTDPAALETLTPVACESEPTEAELAEAGTAVEEVSQGDVTVDPETNEFRFGWSTSKSFAGQCITPVLGFDDGSFHGPADFFFKS